MYPATWHYFSIVDITIRNSMKKIKIIFAIMLSLLFGFSKPSSTLAQDVNWTAAIQGSQLNDKCFWNLLQLSIP